MTIIIRQGAATRGNVAPYSTRLSNSPDVNDDSRFVLVLLYYEGNHCIAISKKDTVRIKIYVTSQSLDKLGK